jgi:hypothetical protein
MMATAKHAVLRRQMEPSEAEYVYSLPVLPKPSLEEASPEPSGVYCDGDHGAAAQEVHDDGEESEKALASEEAREQDSEDAVQHNRARHALNRLLPSWNGLVAIGLHGEEVTVDTEDDASAAELERVEEGRANAQGSAADSHCD